MPLKESRADGAGCISTPGLARSLLPATPAPNVPEAWSACRQRLHVFFRCAPDLAVTQLLLQRCWCHILRFTESAALALCRLGCPMCCKTACRPTPCCTWSAWPMRWASSSTLLISRLTPRATLVRVLQPRPCSLSSRSGLLGLILHAASGHLSAGHPSGHPVQGAALPTALPRHQMMASCITKQP